MSEFGGEMPHFEDEYQPTFQELRERVEQRGPAGLTEFATVGDDGIALITPGRGLDEIRRTWRDEKGNKIEPFANKFTPDFNGWQPGDIVNADYDVINQRGQNNQPVMRVSASTGGAGYSDHFPLTELTPEQRTQLEDIGIAHVTADVEVVGNEQPITLGYSKYDARILRIHEVQQPWDGQTPLGPRQDVLVEGTVTAYNPNRSQDHSDASHTVTVRLKNGTAVPVQLDNGYIQYREGGSIEHIQNSQPEAGDVIQIQACTTDDTDSGVLEANFTNNYLKEPSPNRLAAYQNDRAVAAEHIAGLKNIVGQTKLHSDSFRAAYGTMLKDFARQAEPASSFDVSVQHYIALTKAEQHAIQQVVDTTFAPDDERRPVITDTGLAQDVAVIAERYKAYGIDPYSMSKHDFSNFCTDVAQGAIEVAGNKHASHQIFNVLRKSGFAPQEELAIYTQAIDHMVQHTAGKRLAENDHQVDGATEVSWHETGVAADALDRAAAFARTSPEIRDFLYSSTVRTIQDALTYEGGARQCASRELIFPACYALKTALLTGVETDEFHQLQFADQAHLAFFTDKVPELSRLADALAAAGDSHQASNVNELIDKITRVAALPPKS